MRHSFLLFSTTGYRAPTPEELEEPYRISPTLTHTEVSLGEVLESLASLGKKLRDYLPLKEGETLVIRSEKHGPFYHVCSIGSAPHVYLGLLVAITELGKGLLEKDLYYMDYLAGTYGEYFPKVYGIYSLNIDEVEIWVGVVEWLNGYFEVHATQKGNGICFEIWRPEATAFLSDDEAYKFFRECAEILFRCYDTSHNLRIGNWTHITGDFIYNPLQATKIPVKLTTIREYDCYGSTPEDPKLKDTYCALLYLLEVLFINRIDKDQGVGKFILLPKFTMYATIQAVLNIINQGCNYFKDALSILRTITKQELTMLYEAVISELVYTDEMKVFISNVVEEHVDELLNVIRCT